MITIGICDDERVYRDKLVTYCRDYFSERVEIEIEQSSRGESLIEKELDILLLDIEMPGTGGIELKNRMQQSNSHTRIVFVTSHNELMPKAYGRNVFGFLTKPIDYNLFCEKMQEVEADLHQQGRLIEVEGVHGIDRVHVSDIVYIEAQRKYTYLHLANGENALFDGRSIGFWEKQLENMDFVMSHRSYLVNLDWVGQIDEKEVQLRNDEVVRLGRSYKDIFVDKWRAFMIRTVR